MRLGALLVVCGCGRVAFGLTTDASSSGDGSDARIDDVAVDSAREALIATAFAHYTFDEGTGSATLDIARGNPDMALSGAAWATGVLAGAASADGVNDFLFVSALDLSQTAAVTVAFWIKRVYANGNASTLVELSGNANNVTTGFGIFPDNAGGPCLGVPGIYLFARGNIGYNGRCFAQPSSNAWHYFVAIYDKSQTGAQEVQLYIDGVAQVPTNVPTMNDNTNNFGAESLNVFARGSPLGEFNAGTIDDILLFDRALTPAEIATL